MQIHTLKRNNPNKKRITVGRGSKRGKTSGRGTKGQNARAGRKKRPELRDLIKKIPKLRGRGVNGGKSFREKYVPVSLELIEKNFGKGGEVTPTTLVAAGLVKNKKGKLPSVKILSDGEVTKKLTIKNCIVSEGTKAKIEKAGGEIVMKG